MSEELTWGDEKKYQKKFNLLALGIGILFLIVAGLQFQRSEHLAEMVKGYTDFKTKEKWLMSHKTYLTPEILAKIKRPVSSKEAEKVLNEKAKIFEKNRLLVKSINNSGFSGKQKDASSMSYVDAKAQVEGTWEDIINSLYELKKDHISAITRLELRNDEMTGSIKAQIDYRIYYE